MTSPLLPYANAYLAVEQQGVPEIVDGRVTASTGDVYLVQCYLKRQDSTGTTTGADYLPTQSSPGGVLPGVSGEVYLYRGYALRYAVAPEDWQEADGIPTGLTWTRISSQSMPAWLQEGRECRHLQGSEVAKHCRVERATGKYGGVGIDEIVSSSIGGVPIVVRSGDLTG